MYIAPLKALVSRAQIEDWKVRLENKLNYSVVELTGKSLEKISLKVLPFVLHDFIFKIFSFYRFFFFYKYTVFYHVIKTNTKTKQSFN